jgi:bacterioferritin
MKGNDQVIDVLNEVLTGELTAVNQYFIHAKMCGNWGYKRLHKHIRMESIDEMRHAETLIDRILYLDGVPNLQRYWKLQVGQTVKEQLNADLGVEKKAIELLNRGIELSRTQGDNASRELLEKILVSEEEHADWLEAQLVLIEQVGEPNYLAQQIRED